MADLNPEPITIQMKRLRGRTGLSIDRFAKTLGFAGGSSYQRYEDPEKFNKQTLPLALVHKLIKHVVGMGEPPIQEAEIYALAGFQETRIRGFAPLAETAENSPKAWLKQQFARLSDKNEAGFAEAMGWDLERLAEVIAGDRQIKVTELPRLCHYLEVSLDLAMRQFKIELEFLEPEESSPELDGLYVVGAVQAGTWAEAIQWPRDEWVRLEVPEDSRATGIKRFCLEVRGKSMNLEFPPGTILVCVSLFDIDYEPKDGDHVIVHRRAPNGLTEATVKEIRNENGETWLWPRSDRPEFQQPILLSSQGNNDDGEDVTVTGLVIGRYAKHGPDRLV